jgi:hypothetical membrane protein
MKAFIGKRSYEEFFLLAAIVVSIIVFLLVYAYLYLNQLFIVNQHLVTSLLIICPSISAFLAVIISLYRQKDNVEIFHGLELLFLALTTGIALCFVFGTLGYLFSVVLTYAFQGIIYSNVGIGIIAAAISGLTVYFTASFVFKINQKKLATLMVITFLFGFLLAAAKNNDHAWWASSLCALGMYVNKTPIYYNFTMIITGALMLAFGGFLKPQIKKLSKAGLIDSDGPLVLTILYIIAALNIFLIGIIPYGINEHLNQVHIFFANYAFIHVGVVVLFAIWLFKKFPKKFIIQNYLILVFTAAFYYFNVSRYVMPYAISEIVVIIGTIIWFTLFTRSLKQLSESV